jgi:hypothetical protein
VEVEDASEFYREVLLTYRLVFGQDKSSYKDFNAIQRTGDLAEEYYDSKLAALCGESWESTEARSIYELVAAEDPPTHYDPRTDFPFFGKRLLDIQRYVKGQKPSTFWALWHDDRNPYMWWTLWVCSFKILQFSFRAER